MEKIDLEKFIDLERDLSFGLDLLEIAKCYCEKNSDKIAEVAILNSILDVMLTNQKKVVSGLDKMLIC